MNFCIALVAAKLRAMNMKKRIFKYSLYVSITYIFIVGYLGFAIRDDYFMLTFPSWPFFIFCVENCGYLMIFALILNGLLVGIITFFILYIFSLIFFPSKHSVNMDEQKTNDVNDNQKT